MQKYVNLSVYPLILIARARIQQRVTIHECMRATINLISRCLSAQVQVYVGVRIRVRIQVQVQVHVQFQVIAQVLAQVAWETGYFSEVY